MKLDIKISDPLFKKYVGHVLAWEGLTSKDPDDTAASCAPFKGAYHTNKGVTYCTFTKLAASLGITPVTYNRFVMLTDDDIAKFVFHFCQEAHASVLDDLVALSVTEAAWGSGPNRAIQHLQDALCKMGVKVSVDGKMGPKTLAAAQQADQKVLYQAYWQERREYLDYLTSTPKYAKWKKGWNNRVKAFLKLFS